MFLRERGTKSYKNNSKQHLSIIAEFGLTYFGDFFVVDPRHQIGPAGLHPFSDTSNLQLVHATLFVITAMDLAEQGSHIYQIL